MILFILIVGFLVGLLGLIQPKYSKVCGAITLFALFLAIVFNNGNVDYQSYANNYNSSKFEHDVLFSALESFSKAIGASYDQFVMVTMFVAFMLLTITIYRISINPCAFCFLYFLYPFCLDVIQVRNFLGYSIVFFALPWLSSRSIKGRLIYIAFVALASCIHLECIVYSIVVFYSFFARHRSARIVLGVLLVAIIILSLNVGFLTSYLNAFQINVYNLFNETRVYEMSLYDIGERGYLIFYTIHFINIIMQIIMYKNFVTKRQSNGLINVPDTMCNGERYKKYIEVVMWLNILLTIFIPLYRFQATLFRISRNLMIINYSSLLIFVRYSFCNLDKKRILSSFTMLFVSFLFWFEVIREPNYLKIFMPVIQNNWFNFYSGLGTNILLVIVLCVLFVFSLSRLCRKRRIC